METISILFPSSKQAAMSECCQHTESAPSHEHVPIYKESPLIGVMDQLGIAASTLCMIHCMAMPLVAGLLPLLGLQFLQGHTAHLYLAGFVFLFAFSAIVPSYLKHHRPEILGFMVLGLSFVATATFYSGVAFGEEWEVPLITIGNLIVVATHMRNRILCANPEGAH